MRRGFGGCGASGRRGSSGGAAGTPPRLPEAAPEQREDLLLIGKGIGIHRPQLDEDLSVRGPLWRLARVARSCRPWDLPRNLIGARALAARTLSRARHLNQTRFHGFDPYPRGRTSRLGSTLPVQGVEDVPL